MPIFDQKSMSGEILVKTLLVVLTLETFSNTLFLSLGYSKTHISTEIGLKYSRSYVKKEERSVATIIEIIRLMIVLGT